MPLIGTAGHVDHGKSTLVEALTGRDPDRWEEEKKRGLTIDLGFSWATLDDGTEVSFVDVPGHERYLKNMLAGIETIDAALLVVAADEGWMPQSEEHLAVLDLLGVDRGVVALTKVDLVDADMAELAGLEIREQLEGTSLESVPVIPVSAPTGVGLAALRSALASSLATAGAGGNRPRLWVDRSFSVAGAGTVVTGTLTEGPLRAGDTIEVLPSHRNARVRAIQVHETEVASALPGRRVALNLSGLDRSEVGRGSMIGLPGQWLTTNRFTARLRLPRYLERLPAKGAFHLHFGSGAHPISIRGRREDRVMIQVPHPLPMRVGDRFILRDAGRRRVVAGGIVLDPAPAATVSALEASGHIDPLVAPDEVATALLGLRGEESVARLAAQSGGGRAADAVTVGATVMTRVRWDALGASLESSVAEAHAAHPLRAGVSSATLATGLGITAEVVDALVRDNPRLVRRGPDVATADRTVDPERELEGPWLEASARLGAGLQVPAADDLGLGPEQLHYLIRDGKLVRVSDSLVFLPEQVDQIVTAIEDMRGDFTVAEFRDRTGLSRKYAIPILEWADREGLTIRRGDLRRPR